MLPKSLRDAIWANYVPGQEITKTPSRAYVEVANQVRNWIIDNHRDPRISGAILDVMETMEALIDMKPENRDESPEGKQFPGMMKAVEFLWDFLRDEERSEILELADQLRKSRV